MPGCLRSTILFFLSLGFFSVTSGQDTVVPVHDWKVQSKKLNEIGKYELSFKTAANDGWYIYAPNQVLLEVRISELKFTDSSSIRQAGDFIIDETKVKEESSSIFENTRIKI